LIQAKELINAGADIIDIGAEATGPDAISITAEQEWLRLEPLLTTLIPELSKQFIQPKISIDTRHAGTAQKALQLGVDWINDVSGLTNKAMQNLMSEYDCDVVMMHHLTIPAQREHTLPLNQDPLKLVYEWAERQLDQLSIPRERIIFDVGLSFGKTATQSLELLKNITLFKNLGMRLLIGHSRKSLLRSYTLNPPDERDLETTVLSLYLNQLSVDYLRIHDVDMHARAFKVAASLVPLSETTQK